MSFQIIQGGPKRLDAAPSVTPQTRFHIVQGGLKESRGAFGLGTAVRALAAAPLEAPLAVNRLLTSELVRLGRASQDIPSFQDVAPAIGDIVRKPAQLLGLPTELTAGVGLGTPINPLLRASEQEVQNRLLASAADVGVIQAAPSAVGAIGHGISRLGVTGRVQQALRSRRILQTPVEELVQQARTGGAEAADILGVLRRAGSQKFRPVFEALQAQRELPRRPIALLTSQRGAVPLPDIRPGDFVRFGNQVRKVVSIDPQAQKAVLAVGVERTIVAPLAKLVKATSAGEQPPAVGGVAGPHREAVPGPPGEIEPPIIPPIRKTPSETLEVREPIRPLTRVRQQAIQAVTRDLAEQARILSTESLSLKRRVLEAGGIKPTLAGGLEEELRAIRPFLRQGGRAMDDLATELGFENGEALRLALLTAQRAARPTLAQLRQQAIQIVDSPEGGNRILQAIQTKGATGQAIRRVVREVIQQTESEVSRGLRQVRGLLRGAERKALTPAQIARVAREQRVAPGATVPGPRGGEREAPLAPEEIAQVEQRIGGIVPSGLTPSQRQRAFETGQLPPPQGPPRVPRTTALVPRDIPPPGSLRDIPTFQQTGLGGVDPDRLAEFIDGKPLGWTHRTFIRPAVDADEAQAQFLEDFERRAAPLIEQAKATPRTETSAKLQRFVEGNLRVGETLTPTEVTLEQFGRQTYETLLDQVNAILRVAGKPLIIRRANYAPHFQELSLLESMFGGIEHIPDILLKVPFVSKILQTPRAARAATFRELPEDVLNALPFINPKTPFFRHALKRLGGPFTEDYTEGLRRYVSAVARVIYQTPVVMRARPMLRYLPPRDQLYFRQYLNELVGRPAQIDSLIQFDPFLKQLVSGAGRWQSLGLIGANVSTVMKQPDAIALTLALNGPVATYRGVFRWFDPAGAGRDLVSRYASEFALRQRRGSFLEFAGTSRLDKALTYLLGIMDRQQVGIAWLAGVEKGRMQGITDWETLVGLGNRSAIRTQASMRNLLRSNRLRAQLYRSTFGLLQSFTDNITNFLWFDIGMTKRVHEGSRAALAAALGLLASVGIIKAIYTQLGLPSGFDVGDFMPGALKFKLRSSRFGDPPLVKLFVGIPASLIDMAVGPFDARKRATFQRDLVRTASAFFPGGNQLRKTIEGSIAAAKGGLFTKRGQAQFRIEEPAEILRAVFFGPWGTKAGQAFIRRGFKPTPKKFSRTTPNRPRFRILQGGPTTPTTGRFRIIQGGPKPVRGKLFDDVLK